MAKIFSIDPKQNNIVLDENTRKGSIRFTVTNGSPDELRGKTRVVGVPPCEAAWLQADPDSAAFRPGQAQEFVVSIEVPMTVEEGTYSFRLDAASERNPDIEKTEGPNVAFEVPKGRIDKPGWWQKNWWIPLVVVGVGVLGFVVWKLVQGAPADFDGNWSAITSAKGLQTVEVVQKTEGDDAGGIAVLATYDDGCDCSPCDLVVSEDATISGDSLVVEWLDEPLDLYHTLTLTLEPRAGEGEERTASVRYEMEDEQTGRVEIEQVQMRAEASVGRAGPALAVRAELFVRQPASASALAHRLELIANLEAVRVTGTPPAPTNCP